MESITIYPKNEKQKSLLQSLLQEMKIRFEISKNEEKIDKDAYFAKIDKSINQIKEGKTKLLSIDEQKLFLGL